jgi:2-methylisocitrate lyase-like PEP mutase family enzyme
MEASGASGVVLEDQKRPRRCGHFDGKQIMELDEYLAKLRQVLATRRDLFVIARTDSSDPADIERRVLAFAEAGADAVLVDGLTSLDTVRNLSAKAGRPFCFNQIAGGKSPACTLSDLRGAGVKLVIYSTPCLFAAQPAIEDALIQLKKVDGSLAGSAIGVKDCTAVLTENLRRRDTSVPK